MNNIFKIGDKVIIKQPCNCCINIVLEIKRIYNEPIYNYKVFDGYAEDRLFERQPIDYYRLVNDYDLGIKKKSKEIYYENFVWVNK